MFFTIILSQILAVLCEQNKNIEIELEYELDGNLEKFKLRNVRPIPQEIPVDYEERIVPDLQSLIRDEQGYKNGAGRFDYRRNVSTYYLLFNPNDLICIT